MRIENIALKGTIYLREKSRWDISRQAKSQNDFWGLGKSHKCIKQQEGVIGLGLNWRLYVPGTDIQILKKVKIKQTKPPQ